MTSAYIPERDDIVFLDFEPTKGKEIGKYRPALVLSSKLYHSKTGLLICSPISTTIRGNATEVPVGNLDAPSVVAANLIHTLDWRARAVKKVAVADPGVVNEVLMRLLPLIGTDRIFDNLNDKM